MKLQCQVEVKNSLHGDMNMRSGGRHLKSTLALGKEPQKKNSEPEYFILHFSSVNKTGTKYRIKNMKQVFSKCLNEGKATLRFDNPPHDLYIKSEAIQLKCFLKLLKQCFTGDAKDMKLDNFSSVGLTAKDVAPKAPTKLVIRDRSEFPSKGLPRTLETLTLAGLKLCNFRRDILLLKQLTVLDLSNNEIEKLPAEFGRMCLTELYLANNKLGDNTPVDWRWLLGPQLTKTLKLVDLSNNNLQGLPAGLWKLQRLVTLKVDSNQLDQMPPTIGRITTLRYLTISNNNLSYLPCSLLQCDLEHFDASANLFQSDRSFLGPQIDGTKWDLCVGNLIQIAAKAVLKNKIYYASNLIPFTLVDYLDSANMCVCGSPVINDMFYAMLPFDLRELFTTVVSDSTKSIIFKCYFCSTKCVWGSPGGSSLFKQLQC